MSEEIKMNGTCEWLSGSGIICECDNKICHLIKKKEGTYSWHFVGKVSQCQRAIKYLRTHGCKHGVWFRKR